MFQSVGRPTPTRSRAGAFLLSLAINGGLIAAAFLLGAPVVTPEVVAETTLGRPYELLAPAPAPAPAPGPKQKARRSTLAEPPVVPVPLPTPDETRVEPSPTPSPDPSPVALDDGGGGGGEAGTHGDCTGEGCSGDTPGGDGGGGGGLRTVHWSQVEVRTRAQIRPEDYPRAALEMGLPDARCVVRIEIDTRGVPVAVTPKECPTVFGPAAQAIGLRYRFYPLLDDHRRAIPAAFDLAINFRKP